MDIILNFRTTIVNKFGEEIKNQKEILFKYVIGKDFFIDMMVVAQLHEIFQLRELKLIQVLKITSVNRFYRIL